MNQATLISAKLPGFTGIASLYKLDPPLESGAFVIVSATNALFSGPETYIFAASPEGGIVSWVELEGSFRGDLDHEKALRGAGYAITKPSEGAT